MGEALRPRRRPLHHGRVLTVADSRKVIAPEDSYVAFVDEGPTASGKTRRWSVRNQNSGGRLGMIKWYGSWRRYCFFPRGDIVLSAGCMTDITAFIEERMERRGES